VCAVCGGGFEYLKDSVTEVAMRSEKNGVQERALGGITPCVHGDSLLTIPNEVEKFAGGPGRASQLFPPGSASMFSPTVIRPVKFFEVRRNQ
jgi:hypothetical protein